MITVFLRYDDYSALSPREVDEGLIGLLRRCGISCTFGIIPSVTVGEQHHPGEREEVLLDGGKLQLLADALRDGVVEPAIHGWNHRTHARALPPAPSEFAGLSLEEQTRRLERACSFLEDRLGRRPRTFIPPWNSYDTVTLDALDLVGITCISANREGAAVGSSSLHYSPITIEMKDLKRAVAAARNSDDPDPVIGVMIHPYDFHESGDPRSSMSLADLERELAALNECVDVVVGSVAEAIDAAGMTAARYRSNRATSLERVFPPFIGRTQENPVFLSETHATADKRRRVLGACVVHMAVAVAAFLIVRFGLLMPGATHIPVGGAIAVIAVLGIAVLLARSVAERAVYFRAAVVLSALAGMLVGSLR